MTRANLYTATAGYSWSRRRADGGVAASMMASTKVVTAGHHDVPSLHHVVSRRKYSRRRGNTSCYTRAIHDGAPLYIVEAHHLQPKRFTHERVDVIYSGGAFAQADAKLSAAARVCVLSVAGNSRPFLVADDRERAVDNGGGLSTAATNYLRRRQNTSCRPGITS